MAQTSTRRPDPPAADPRLTVLPAISAPIDQGRLIPPPPRPLGDRLLWIAGILVGVGTVLVFAFLHATPMR